MDKVFAYARQTLLFVFLLALGLSAQESLQESLQEEGDYYNNFGLSGYSKKEIEQQKIPYYDDFGKHVVNGYLIYGLQTERNRFFDSDGNIQFRDPKTGAAVSDTTVNAYSNMFQTSLVSENFNNLIMAQDGLGEMKSVFLIGSQINTRFTPLTMNKLNFQGVRWDIWTPTLKFTTMLSRTRPFIMSQNDVSGRSYVAYDQNDKRNWQGVRAGELLPDEDYIIQNWAGDVGDFTQRKNGWILNYDYWDDYSTKSIYGDYDILWGFHGKTNIANVADVGVSYLNHHRSDIKKGEKIFSGDVPEGYVPDEIHFEFYDLTPNIDTDPGCKVQNITMTMNGQDLLTDGEGAAFMPKDNYQLAPSSMQVEVSGNRPLIVVFNTALVAQRKFGGISGVSRIDFKFKVSGNYIVFVSTDKMVSYGFSAQRSTQSNDVAIDGPFTRKVADLTGDFTPIADGDRSQGTNKPIGGPSVSSGWYWNKYGNSWFGEYIAKSPRTLFAED
ncbi:MAG: hypothetical protein V1913_04300, partial [Fibrobacterota bacterium]